MITVASASRTGAKSVPKSIAVPKVLIAGEIIRMTNLRIAETFKVKGKMQINGMRQQWLDWLDSYPEPLTGAQHAAWAFEQEQEVGRPEAYEPAKVRL